MGTEFTFYDYVENDGTNPILDWLNSLGLKGRLKFNVTIDHLAATPKGEWRRPWVDTLTGDCDGFFEIRRTVARVEQRLIGFHHPISAEEIILEPLTK